MRIKGEDRLSLPLPRNLLTDGDDSSYGGIPILKRKAEITDKRGDRLVFGNVGWRLAAIDYQFRAGADRRYDRLHQNLPGSRQRQCLLPHRHFIWRAEIESQSLHASPQTGSPQKTRSSP